MRPCPKYEKVIQLLPGPTGPTGPMGPDTVIPVTRALKVQFVEDVLTPIIIEGFLWEEDVTAPVGWPLAGTYTFYKATVLDEPQFNLSELLNTTGTITHNDVMVQQQAAVAHYRADVLQDIHWASSLIVEDTIDTLVTQTLHDVIIGDCLYFGITPDVSSLSGFNYNINSVRCVPTFKIPDELPISLPIPSAGLLSGPFKAIVTAPISVTLQLMSAGDGGGVGGSSVSESIAVTIGGAGGGGGSGAMFSTAAAMSLALSVNDVLDWQIGGCGSGGVGVNNDGKDGGESSIKLNSTPLSGAMFTGPNPVSGGDGGKAGTLMVGGDGGASIGLGGGGGGAPCLNGIPGPPGMGVDGGMDGDTDPRKGGEGGGGNPGGSSGSLGIKGSGGGGGGAFIVGGGGEGGNGGFEEEVAGFPGQNAFLVNGGGGGGSGGVPDPNESTPGGRGGIGGLGSIKILLA